MFCVIEANGVVCVCFLFSKWVQPWLGDVAWSAAWPVAGSALANTRRLFERSETFRNSHYLLVFLSESDNSAEMVYAHFTLFSH